MSRFVPELRRSRTGADSVPSRGAIVFVNSLATTWRMWDGVVSHLPPGWDVLRYDQRDRGGTSGPFSLDDLVDDLVSVLDAAEVWRAHVVGVSLGGMVGLRAAARRPDRVPSLTAMCCAARFPRATWVERAAAVRRDGVGPLVPAVIDRWFTRGFQTANAHLVAEFREMLATTDGGGYAFASDLLAEADVRPDLPAIVAPTLVISGEEDTANPVADLELIADRVRGARLEILPGVAHLAPVAVPERIADLVSEHAEAHRL